MAGVRPFERLSECVKRKTKNIPIWLCIVPPPKAGEQYERTAILYHQLYVMRAGEKEGETKISMRSRNPVTIIGALVLCGVIFVALKLLFPGRNSRWYMNRIKLTAGIVLFFAALILFFTRQ